MRENQVLDGADFYCFTDDKNLASNTWQIRLLEQHSPDPRRNAKLPKILIHKYLPGYEYTIWMDASFILKAPAKFMITKYLAASNIALFKHFKRSCLYDEAAECIKLNLDKKEVIENQINRYKAEGYPENNGLHECGIILRRSCKEVEKFNELWWQEVENGCRRDQISVDYCLYKSNLKVTNIDGGIRNNKYFRITGHTRYKSKPKLIRRNMPGIGKKLIMNVNTTYEGIPFRPGDQIDVDEKTAQRWVNKGIAHYEEAKVEPIKKKPIKKNSKSTKK